MKIKKFNQINENTDSKLDGFYKKYKKLFMDQENAEEGEEYTNGEMFTEVGQLINEFGLTKSELKKVIDNYDTGFDYVKTLEVEYDEWDKFSKPTKMDDIVKKYQEEEDRHGRYFMSFVKWLKENGYKIVLDSY